MNKRDVVKIPQAEIVAAYAEVFEDFVQEIKKVEKKYHPLSRTILPFFFRKLLEQFDCLYIYMQSEEE